MGSKLYVGNLAFGVTDAELQEMFQAHGSVRSAQVIMDRDTGRLEKDSASSKWATTRKRAGGDRRGSTARRCRVAL